MTEIYRQNEHLVRKQIGDALTTVEGQVTGQGGQLAVLESFKDTLTDGEFVFRFNSVITPAAIGADTHNYNPTGLATCNVIRASASTPGFSITGLAAQAAGTVILFCNIGTSFSITLVDESGSSTEANRFVTNSGLSQIVTQRSFVILWYDGTTARWRVGGL